MRVWRISKARYATTAFSGEGARLFAGRWNHAGTPVVYTASSVALAVLETLVHTQVGRMPPNLVVIPADVPDDLIERQDMATLPVDWARHPPGDATRAIATEWVRAARSAALWVPSAVIGRADEGNVLLDPHHPSFGRITLGSPEPFGLDPRLLDPASR